MQDYAVDIPNPNNPADAWVNMDYFDTREEAIAWCCETFGADEEGRICLVSKMPDDDDTYPACPAARGEA